MRYTNPRLLLTYLPMVAAWYQTWTVTDSALLTLELVSPPESLRDSVTEVFQLLVLKFGTVFRLNSRLRTWRLTVSNEDLRPICLHWCDEISAPSDYWFLALYKYSACMYVCMYVCMVSTNSDYLMWHCNYLWTLKTFKISSCSLHICRHWLDNAVTVLWSF